MLGQKGDQHMGLLGFDGFDRYAGYFPRYWAGLLVFCFQRPVSLLKLLETAYLIKVLDILADVGFLQVFASHWIFS